MNLPVDRLTKKVKGFAHITFMMPEHAVQAFTQLDGTVFQVTYRWLRCYNRSLTCTQHVFIGYFIVWLWENVVFTDRYRSHFNQGTWIDQSCYMQYDTQSVWDRSLSVSHWGFLLLVPIAITNYVHIIKVNSLWRRSMSHLWLFYY